MGRNKNQRKAAKLKTAGYPNPQPQPKALTDGCDQIDRQYCAKLKKSRERIVSLRKDGRALMGDAYRITETMRPLDINVAMINRDIKRLTTMKADAEKRLQEEEPYHRNAMDTELQELNRLTADRQRLQKEATEAARKVEIQRAKMDKMAADWKQIFDTAQTAKACLTDRMETKAQYEDTIRDYTGLLQTLKATHAEHYGDELDTLTKQFDVEINERAEKITTLTTTNFRQNLRSARTQTRWDIVHKTAGTPAAGSEESTDVPAGVPVEVKVERLIQTLESEMKFFEAILERAKNIAKLEPYVSHALLEIAKYEYLNHDNENEYNVVLRELKSIMTFNVRGDKNADSEKRHVLRKAVDKRLEFLDSKIDSKRNGEADDEDLDPKAKRECSKYLKYIESYDLTTEKRWTFLGVKAYYHYWNSLLGKDGASLEEIAPYEHEYKRIKDEWEFQITCELGAIKNYSKDPVLSSVYHKANNMSTFQKPTAEKKEGGSGRNENLAICTFKEQVDKIEEYFSQDLGVHYVALRERLRPVQERLTQLVEQSKELKGIELTRGSELINDDYVEGDMIEPYVRRCLTYGRDYVDTQEYPITCDWAIEIMEKKKEDIETNLKLWGGGYVTKLTETYGDGKTGCKENDHHVQTKTQFASLRKAFLSKIPQAMNAALKERKDADEQIQTEAETYIDGLLDRIK